MFESLIAPVAGGLVGSLFGGPQQPEIPDQVLRAYQMQMRLAQRFRQQSRDPNLNRGEQAALGQQQGLLGEQYAALQQAMQGAIPGQDPAMAADQQRRMADSLMAGQMANTGAAYQQAQQSRQQQALMAGQMAGQAGSSVRFQPQQQPPDLGAMFGQLSQAYTYNRERDRMAKMLGQGTQPAGGVQYNAPTGQPNYFGAGTTLFPNSDPSILAKEWGL